MNYTTQKNATSCFMQNKNVLVMLFVLFLLLSTNMFGQCKSEVVLPVDVPTSKAIVFDSDLDFMNWFMGTKQTQGTLNDASEISTTSSKKKQLLSLGIIPNKVLYKTFVKKVMTQENAVV